MAGEREHTMNDNNDLDRVLFNLSDSDFEAFRQLLEKNNVISLSLARLLRARAPWDQSDAR
jgi:uncharacterized protein (DUF1778 family)